MPSFFISLMPSTSTTAPSFFSCRRGGEFFRNKVRCRLIDEIARNVTPSATRRARANAFSAAARPQTAIATYLWRPSPLLLCVWSVTVEGIGAQLRTQRQLGRPLRLMAPRGDRG